MGPAVYILAALTSAACAWLLLSSLCFLFLAVANILLFLDLVVISSVDLYRWRLVSTIFAISLLLYGLIWEN